MVKETIMSLKRDGVVDVVDIPTIKWVLLVTCPKFLSPPPTLQAKSTVAILMDEADISIYIFNSVM